MSEAFRLSNARSLAHDAVRRVLRPGMRAVDATMGNGHDTLFLSRLVGQSGGVDAFDVQERALAATRARLLEAGVSQCVLLHLLGHERMADVVAPGVHAVLFNLGWLPGGDKSVTTHVSTTLAALDAALSLLAPGGILSVCIYPGHEEGARELAAIAAWASGLSVREHTALLHSFLNHPSNPPAFLLVQRAVLEEP